MHKQRRGSEHAGRSRTMAAALPPAAAGAGRPLAAHARAVRTRPEARTTSPSAGGSATNARPQATKLRSHAERSAIACPTKIVFVRFSRYEVVEEAKVVRTQLQLACKFSSAGSNVSSGTPLWISFSCGDERERSRAHGTSVSGVEHMGGINRHQQMEETMESHGGLWSALPPKLLERVLSFLSVPDLCRYRSVCKEWNALICTPEFGAFCLQHAGRRPINGACLVFKLPTGCGCCSEFPSWCIFDLTARRWYNVKNTLPEGHDHQGVLAMDGGLVCTFVNAFTDEQRRASTVCNSRAQRQTLIVSNHVGKTMMMVPNPPLPNVLLPCVYLQFAVDSISRTYKIYIVQVADRFHDFGVPFNMCIYESSTNQWRIPSSPPSPMYGQFVGVYECSLMYQGLLYVLYANSIGHIQQLYSYNFVEDAWEDTGVKFYEDDMIDMRNLVVSDNCLFIMREYMNYNPMSGPSPLPMLDIREILLAKKACKVVVQITNGEVMQKCDFLLNGHNVFYSNIAVRTYGFDESILLMTTNILRANEEYTKIYINMLFNLVIGLWEFLPSLNLIECYYTSLSGHTNRMSYLCLPTIPW